MAQSGGAGARSRVPDLPAGPSACSRGTVTYHLAAVNEAPGNVVVRKKSGVEVQITSNCAWPHYTVRLLRSQLAELDVFDDVSENSGGWADIIFVSSSRPHAS